MERALHTLTQGRGQPVCTKGVLCGPEGTGMSLGYNASSHTSRWDLAGPGGKPRGREDTAGGAEWAGPGTWPS